VRLISQTLSAERESLGRRDRRETDVDVAAVEMDVAVVARVIRQKVADHCAAPGQGTPARPGS
jgi:hypothetical protein